MGTVSRPALAATSDNLNFQARLLTSSGAVVPDGNYHIEFKIYDSASAGASAQGVCSLNSSTDDCWWLETRTTGNLVRVVNGYFSVNLGSVTAFGSSIPWDQPLWLTMNIGGTGGTASWDGEMLASGNRIKLTGVPYAFRAGTLAKNNGTQTGTLSFNTVANSPVITLPDASGTLCIQGASVCGFAPGTAASYIQNGTSVQSAANFAIQSAAAGSIGGLIRGHASQSANLLELQTGTPTTVLSVSASGAFLSKNSTNSTSAFQIQNATGGGILSADTSNANITLLSGNSGETNAWQSSSSLSVARTGVLTVTGNGYIYAVGGDNGGSNNNVQYAKLNADGTVGSWTNQANALPANRSYMGGTVANGYIYLVSGTSSGIPSGAQATIYYSKINADGSTAATWSSQSPSGLSARQAGSVASYNGYLYLLGGRNTSDVYTSTVQYAKLNPDGTTATWTTTTALPDVADGGSAMVANGYMYYIGGFHSGPNTWKNTTYYGKVNSDGTISSWGSTSTLNTGRNSLSLQTVVLNGYIYVLGGQDSTLSILSSVEYAKLNSSTGTVSAWTTATNSLPAVRADGGVVAANGYMYYVGGTNGTTAQTSVYYASTSRLQLNGSLDLVGLSGQNLNEGNSGGQLTAGNTRIVGDLSVQNNATFRGSLSLERDFINRGSALFQNSSNSTTAFQVQNAAGSPLFNIDTSTTQNLLSANPGFEVDTSGWTIKGSSTISRSTAEKYHGNASLQVVTSVNPNDGAKYSVSLNASTTYALSFYVKTAGATGQVSTLEIGRAENGSTDTSCATAQTAISTSWTRITCTFLTGDTTPSSPYIYIKQTAASAITFYIDAVQLETKTNLITNPGFEVNTTGWTARALSTLTRTTTAGQFNSGVGAGSLAGTGANAGANFALSLSSDTTYTFQAYVKASGSNITTMELGFAANGSTDSPCQSNLTATTSAFTLFTCTFRTGTTSGSPYVYIRYTAAGSATFFFDSVQLFTGTNTSSTVYQTGEIAINGVITSPTSFRNQSNSTTAFQIQNADGESLLNIDSANSNITLLGNNAGIIQPWQTGNNSGFTGTESFASVSANGYIYVIGGIVSGGTTVSTVQYAKVNANGNVGNWSTTSALPAVRGYASAAAYGGYVYLTGGSTNGAAGGATDTVYYAKLNQDGTLGTWQTGTAVNVSGSQKRWKHTTVAYNGYLYSLAGINDSGSFQNTTYYSKLNADGSNGPWANAHTGAGIGVVGEHSSVVANGYVYTFGGSSTALVQYAKINSNGTVGAWVATTSLPQARFFAGAGVANGYVYVIGGADGSSVYKASTYFAPLNADGTIGSWSCQGSASDCTGTTPINNTAMPATRDGFGNTPVSVNGRFYVIGGWNGSVNNTVYYTSISRVSITGALDLVGLSGENLNEGGTGGELIAGNTNVVGSLNVQGASTLRASLSVRGSATFSDSNNSTSAFQIQDSSGSRVMNVSTSKEAATVTVEKNATLTGEWQPIVSGNASQAGTYSTITQPTNVTGVLALVPTINRSADGAKTLSYNNTSKTLTWGSGSAITISSTTNASYLLPDGSGGTIIVAVTAASLPGSNQSDSLTVATSAATAGFGVGDRDTVRGSIVFNGDIYAGFENDNSDRAEIWRSRDGLNWVKAASDSFGDGTLVDHVDSMIVYNNYLYAGTDAGRIYRTKDGTFWSLATATPGGDNNISAFAVYRGHLYAAQANGAVAAQVYRSVDGVSWVKVFDFPESQLRFAHSLIVHGDRLYASAGNFNGLTGGSGDGEIHSTADGLTWTQSGTDGFGSANNTDISALVSLNTYLYAATFNATDGAQIWRSNDGGVWEQMNASGFGDADNDFIHKMQIYNGYIYAGTQNDTDNGQIWRSTDGRNWSQINTNGFGESKDQRIRSFFVHRGWLYANAANDLANDGWELWRLNTGVVEITTGGLFTQSIQVQNVSLSDRLTGLVELQAQSGSFSGVLGVAGDFTATGNSLFQASANSTTAFQIQNNTGGNLVNVDTTNAGNITLFGNYSGETSAWTSQGSNLLPAARRYHSTTTGNGYIYVTGGENAAGTDQSTVYYAKVNNDGSTGAWTTSANPLPQTLLAHSSVVANGYIYVIGGSENGNTGTNNIRYAKLNSDGSNGAWTLNATTVTNNRTSHTSIVANGYLYVIGGSTTYGGASQNTVYYARLNADGSVGTFASANTLASARSWHSSVVANGYVYVLAGDDSLAVQTNTVQYAKLNLNGTTGTWTSQGSNLIPANRSDGLATVSNGYVYYLGGILSGTVQSTAYFAQLNSDGTTGAWTTSANALPAVRNGAGQQTVSINGYLYFIGGDHTNGTNANTNVYYASTARLKVGANLDLIGLGGENLAEGGSGGSLSAGNTFISGSLQATGDIQFWGSLSVDKGLTVSGATLLKNSTDSTTAFQIQQAGSGSVIFTADTTNLVIKISGNTTTFATLHIENAHFKSTQTTAPTIGTPTNCGAAAGPSAAVTSGSTDSAGSFTITSGATGTPTTCDTVLTFNKAYGAAPKSIIVRNTTAVGSATGIQDVYISASSTTTFTVKFTANNAANGVVYGYYYWVVE